MLTSTRQSSNMQVLLSVEQADAQATVTVIIGKPMESPPISAEMLTVILETTSGNLLKPQTQPSSGMLPETHTRGATASAQFTFDADASPQSSSSERFSNQEVIQPNLSSVDHSTNTHLSPHSQRQFKWVH